MKSVEIQVLKLYEAKLPLRGLNDLVASFGQWLLKVLTLLCHFNAL